MFGKIQTRQKWYFWGCWRTTFEEVSGPGPVKSSLWWNEVPPRLSFFPFFFEQKPFILFYINILQKVGRLVSSVPFSKPTGQQRWSHFKNSSSCLSVKYVGLFSSFSLQLPLVMVCAKSHGWTMERCRNKIPSCQALPSVSSFYLVWKATNWNFVCRQHYLLWGSKVTNVNSNTNTTYS